RQSGARRHRHLARTAAQPDALVTFAKIDLAQIVPIHQGDQSPNHRHVERPGVQGRFVRHGLLLRVLGFEFRPAIANGSSPSIKGWRVVSSEWSHLAPVFTHHSLLTTHHLLLLTTSPL